MGACGSQGSGHGRVAGDVQPESQFIARQRLEVVQHKIFGPISGGLDCEIGESPRAQAGVAPYPSLESGLGVVRNVFGVIAALTSWISVRQGEGADGVG